MHSRRSNASASQLKSTSFSSYDVIVCGGSLAGILSALRLARGGQRVLLLEKAGYLGGALTNGLLPYIPESLQSDSEVLQLLRKRLGDRHGIDLHSRVHIEDLKLTLDEMVGNCEGLTLRYHTAILGVHSDKGRIQSLFVHSKSGTEEFHARAFIDASQNYLLARLCIPTGEPELRSFFTGRFRVGGCTYVCSETALVPSFNNLSVYFDKNYANASHAARTISKLKRGLEQDPFDEIVSLDLSAVLGSRVRVRRLIHNRDRLCEFTFQAPVEQAHLCFRDLSWGILNDWKENRPGFEDAYLCLSAPELDHWNVRMPAVERHPKFFPGGDFAFLRQISSADSSSFSDVRESAVYATTDPVSFRARSLENLWILGDSRVMVTGSYPAQVTAPGLCAAWAESTAETILSETRTKQRFGKAKETIRCPLLPEEIADIVIIGGGPSGVAAALAAARHGVRVTLIEQSYDLGGNGTTGGVTSFAGGARGGIYDEVLEELHRRKFKFPGNQAFDAEGYRWVLDRLLRENGVRVVLGATLIHSQKSGANVESVTVFHQGRLNEFKARFFIDASGDAELSQLAGVATEVGRESDGKTQPVSLMYQIAHHGEGPHLNFFWRIPHGRYLVNATRVAALGINANDLTEAEIKGRKQMHDQVQGLQAQFGYRLVHSGPRVGVRETRRIVGHYTLTVQDVRSGSHFEDGIGKCNYFLDIHNPDGKIGTFAENVPTYDIPFRCLIPRGIDNLLVVGRCISMSHEAMSSLRVMPPCFVIGQAGGTAAALCLRLRSIPSQLPVRLLRDVLKKNGIDLER